MYLAWLQFIVFKRLRILFFWGGGSKQNSDAASKTDFLPHIRPRVQTI